MQIMTCALTGLALYWHGLNICIQTLVALDCLLCTGKLLQPTAANSMINNQLTIAALMRLLNEQPGDCIIERAPQAFRRALQQLIGGLLLLASETLVPQAFSEPRTHWMSLWSKAAGQTNVLHSLRETSLQDIAAASLQKHKAR